MIGDVACPLVLSVDLAGKSAFIPFGVIEPIHAKLVVAVYSEVEACRKILV